ncbi:MAG TPA: PIG-L family deacetylase, partial [Myxococcota bacterium]|nr:PIG-L family deacetylase [Myxococcota bacterium]
VLADLGARVELIAMTSGEAGTDYMARDGGRLSGAELGAWREGELRESAALLGVVGVDFWRLPDGRLDAVVGDGGDGARGLDVARRLVERLRDAEIVLTLGRDGIYGHRDHVAVTRWVEVALSELGQATPEAFGVVFEPGVFDAQWTGFSRRRPELAVADWIAKGRGTASGEEALRVAIGGVEAVKRAAIRAHKSQLRGPDEAAFFVPGTLPLMLGEERFERLGPRG